MVRGLISNIQRYSTQDGPGIRSTVFLVSCNLRCKWCSNPELMLPKQKLLYFKNRCQRCGNCLKNEEITADQEGYIVHSYNLANHKEISDSCPYDAFEVAGYEISVDETIELLMKDQAFYEDSGGGVTFSGGEPLLQSEYVYECASRLQALGVHVSIDTALLAPWSTVERICSVSDLLLVDIKAIDEKLHLENTGVKNEQIIENIRKLNDYNQPIWVRLPLIHNENDEDEDFKKRIQLIKEIKTIVNRVDILPYHNLGEGKYRSMNLPYFIKDGLLKEEQIMLIENEMKQLDIPYTLAFH